jgi:hypothetical protein
MEARFTDSPGVTEATARCDEPLPLSYECSVTVSVAREITPEHLANVLDSGRLAGANADVSVQVQREFTDAHHFYLEFARDGAFNADLDDEQLATLFVDGVASPHVTIFGLESRDAATGEDGRAPVLFEIDYTTVPVEQRKPGAPEPLPPSAQVSDAMAAADMVLEAIPHAEGVVRADALHLEMESGLYPAAEIALYDAIVARFPVSIGYLGNGSVRLRLEPTADVAAAQAFAEQQPSYASIPTVIIDIG